MDMDTTKKFSGKSEGYAKYRPHYPEAFLEYLLALTPPSPKVMVADIGAGTGILTRQLLEHGYHVTAVEPNADMRKTAREYLSGFPGSTLADGAAEYIGLADGTAEHTGLADASIAMVTVAQAFHWFDPKKFRMECNRILLPDAPVILVWNNRNPDAAITKESAEICREYCPLFKGFSGGSGTEPESMKVFFRDGSYQKMEFSNPFLYNLQGFLGRYFSSSYAPKQNEASAKPFTEALTKLFQKYEENGRIEIPGTTASYLGNV